jgi:hypothetical protein
MSTRHLRVLCAIAISASVAAVVITRAQTADEPNEGLRLVADPAITNGYQVSWWGRTGRTYFLQRSEDLTGLWSYFPIIEFGQDAPITYGFINASPLVFARVTYLNQVVTDPYNTDSDGDGLTNQQEFDAKTDPFKADTDGDGMPDKWELDHGLDPRNPADASPDPDGDGQTNLQEFTAGTDPKDYYNGQVPIVTVVSGDGQIGPSGAYLDAPLVLRVTHADGTPLSNAPVSMKVMTPTGKLALDPSDPAATRVIKVRTDIQGIAQVYWQLQGAQP